MVCGSEVRSAKFRFYRSGSILSFQAGWISGDDSPGCIEGSATGDGATCEPEERREARPGSGGYISMANDRDFDRCFIRRGGGLDDDETEDCLIDVRYRNFDDGFRRLREGEKRRGRARFACPWDEDVDGMSILAI